MSLALGSKEVSLIDIASAYASIANRGKVIEPVFIKSVSNDEFEWKNPELELNALGVNSVYDPITVYQLQSMLKGVTEYGTAWRAFEGSPYVSYGKTGTSNSANDVWYIGFTENVVIGVFAGFDNPTGLGKGESGGRTAAPIVRSIMDKIYSSNPNLMSSDFPLPNGVNIIEINPDTGVPTKGGFEEIFRE